MIGIGGARPIIEGNAAYAIRFSGSGLFVEHLELTSDSTCELEHRVVFGNGSDVDFVDVLIRDGGYDGFGTYCDGDGIPTNVRLIDSEVRTNGLACDLDGSARNGDGIDLYGCHDCEVVNTHVHGNNLFAIQIKGGANDVTVRDSVLESDSGFGLLVGRPGNAGLCPGETLNAQAVSTTPRRSRTRTPVGF